MNKPTPKTPTKNEEVEIFRLNAERILSTYVFKIRSFIAEDKLSGSTVDSIAAAFRNPKSRPAIEREAARKELKSEVAGLINRLRIAGYFKEIGIA